MSFAEHLVAHTRYGDESLVEPDRARWLWSRLRAGFPDAEACVLMPDHPHLVVPPGGDRRFDHILRGFTARFGVRFDVPPPAEVRSPQILARAIRYAFRNPVSAKLARDAWSWSWSSLRDLAGLVHEPWTDAARVSRRTRRAPDGLLAFVSDHTPRPGVPPTLGLATFEACAAAVAACLRCDPSDVHRRGPARHLFVQLAVLVGSPSTRDLAKYCRAAETTVRRLRATPHPALHAAHTCLADPRLLNLP